MKSQSIKETFVKNLKEIGFNQTTALLYTKLLIDGPNTETELLEAKIGSKYSINQAKQLLLSTSLISRKILKTGKPALYAPNPKRTWTANVAKLVWSYNPKLNSITELSNTGNTSIDDFRKKCDFISEIAQFLYTHQDVLTLKNPISTENEHVLANMIAEAISNANSEIRAMSTAPRLSDVANIWHAITDRLNAGCRYRRITDKKEIIDHGLGTVRRDIHGAGVELRLLPTHKISKSYYVIDSRFLIIQDKLTNDNSSNRVKGGTLSKHRHMIKRHIKNFENNWENALDARDIVYQLQLIADNLVMKSRQFFTPEQTEWLVELVRLGKFSSYIRRNQWSNVQRDKTIRIASKNNLIKFNYLDEPIPNYNVGFPQLSNNLVTGTWKNDPPCENCWETLSRCSC